MGNEGNAVDGIKRNKELIFYCKNHGHGSFTFSLKRHRLTYLGLSVFFSLFISSSAKMIFFLYSMLTVCKSDAFSLASYFNKSK